MRRHGTRWLASILMVIMCFNIVVGSTFAYFTDEVKMTGNIIASGSLKAGLEYATEYKGAETQWTDASEGTVFNDKLWEPNFTSVRYIRISNKGNLAFQYELNVIPTQLIIGEANLMDVIDVYFGVVTPNQKITKDNYASLLQPMGTLTDLLGKENGAGFGILLPEKGAKDVTLPADATSVATGSVDCALVLHMQHTAGNEYMNCSVGDGFKLQLAATQYTWENDAFNNRYDADAKLPDVVVPTQMVVHVTPDENGLVPQDVQFVDATGHVTATVPAGAKMAPGATSLRLIIAPKAQSEADVSVAADEVLSAYEVCVEGLAEDNTVPVQISMGKVLATGLNIGNYSLYHVEDGATHKMTRVPAVDASSAHNSFSYDPATGDVAVAMATFSEVALVADTENAWNGTRDYTWYNADATELTIANADQLAGLSAIVGGMDGKTADTFKEQTIKLISDVNLGYGVAGHTYKIFYPIGYCNNDENAGDGGYEKTNADIDSWFEPFEGTFDGNGHTISNFYQNTWEMKGDHNWYSPEEQYYRDGMGLFGKVYGGTVKNLTVDNFKSDGEIATTGVIAAYADGATFENIAITNCNPRVYNIGNGGIVGCVGWYAKEANLKTTFTNITVDNSNKISALWGSYDVACGGIVGQYYPTSGQSSANYPVNAGIHFENCHVSAIMDVYNDVCANYQYYAYRYAGMIIGSIRENETIDGHVYPKMDGITASGCTVHFGTWNDYYYCEIIDNTTASYTHDYQMSRLTEIKAIDGTTVTYLDGTTGTVPASGRANYVIVDYAKGHGTENATCYHFKNGAVWKHEDGGKETINGVEVLKEDKQHIYLEFNNLFTGYGWGVTSKGITDYEQSQIKILDREVADSVKKFVQADTAKDSYTTESTVTIGELFKAATIEDKKLSIKGEQVQVFVSPVDETSTAVGTYTANTTDWTQGTLTFSGTGAATITITDYYFCTPTVITVNITERVEEVKFESKFTGNFLYRVGNQNTVSLGSLFKAVDGVTIGDTVSVTVEAVEGTTVSGAYTSNATWTNGTIQFSGTGVVKVTITDNDYCTPAELYLEVVDATNLTSATGTTSGGTFVLLNDVNASNYVYYWNSTLYGNGFTYSLNGAPTNYSSSHGHGVLITKNATLDNLVIVGDVYNSYGAYTNQDYYNAAVDVAGDTVIQNCYISGCAAPVKARANATITNTTLYGGTVANLIIMSGTVTLENVTTANYDDGRSLVGMGIVIHSDAQESAKLVLNGTLTQYNFISESKVPNDTYAKNLYTTMFGDSCIKYHFGTSPNRYVNTGIVSLAENFNAEDITDNAKTGYVEASVTLSGNKGYVYTQPNTSGSVNNNCPKYEPTTQGAVPPSYGFDYTNKNYVAKTDGSNDYCYEENGIVSISMDKGDTFNWDTSILTLGKDLTEYTVSMNGTDYTGKSIAFNTAGDYVVTYTYTDDNNYNLDENGNITTYSVTYKKTVNITVAVVEAATKHAEFTFGSSNTASTTVTVGNNTYVMPNVTSTSSTVGSTTVDGKTIYYPIVEIVMSDGKTSHTGGWYAYFPVFSGAVTITDYKDNGLGDAEEFGSKTQSMPSGLSIVGDPAQLFKYQSSSTAGTSPVVKNEILVYSSPSISAKRSEYNTVIQYSYQDNAGATYYYYIGYHAPAQSYTSCVTPDTLVTLADGSKKEIQYVTYEDQLMVWDFYKGEYAVVPSAIIFNHGEGDYNIVHLTFDDGTTVKIIAEHRFLDAATNEFVVIDEFNAADYIGHSFYKRDGENVTTAKLVSAEVKKEHSVAYSLISAVHYNFFVEDMFSSPFLSKDVGAFEYFDIAKDELKYTNIEEDIAQYGTYTYEDFADLITEEQFNAFNAQYMKIAVGKGDFTWDEIVRMINEYLQ